MGLNVVRKSRRGFSLLELMVVLATVSVIASLGAPRLAHAFKKARAVEAQQTLSAIERALKEHYNRTGEYPRDDGAPNPVPLVGKAPFDRSLPGWKDIAFVGDSDYRYRYQFDSQTGASGKYTKVTIVVTGDTDGDGVHLRLQRDYDDGVLILAENEDD